MSKFKPSSDIDLALKGKPLNLEELLALYDKLEQLNSPHTFDLINYTTIKEPDLIAHIDRVGQVL
ncbi:hypothetical protein [Pontibacter chitinilyticus]|uniref:hypothetical protein n=1 Tax=Pontibacter chitinilyticus TaxID=2674989 RepID=UPI00321A3197